MWIQVPEKYTHWFSSSSFHYRAELGGALGEIEHPQLPKLERRHCDLYKSAILDGRKLWKQHFKVTIMIYMVPLMEGFGAQLHTCIPLSVLS